MPVVGKGGGARASAEGPDDIGPIVGQNSPDHQERRERRRRKEHRRQDLDHCPVSISCHIDVHDMFFIARGVKPLAFRLPAR